MIGVRGAVATQVQSPVTALTPVQAKRPQWQINLPSAIAQPAISWAAKINRAGSPALHLE
jgi:hypothetical protein